ncbi:hypothetical protein BWI93_27225 [Siphonobacter sp. BAB-5385]|uniref:patatin-like phospholipase family protein n=1 Tax=Siphonobacter sp. BAB-5385 TaxID=1864822 RepID=UPI000B9E559A|nr:patatin-like phospholipase family protein [Siphonobacter sp. BAB-5385]OZI05108.1 hypothetical protein BWI93_27225 [Siphonobacter sp. BAB-5385]
MIQNQITIDKLAAIFQGGAFNFHFHVGIIKTFEKYNVWPDYIEAVSAGTLASVFLAMRKTKELYALADRLVVEQHKMIWTSPFINEQSGQISVDTEAVLAHLGIKGNVGTIWQLVTNKKKVLKKAGDQLKKLPALADNTPLFELLKQHVKLADMAIPFRCRFVCYDTGDAVSVGPEDFDDDTEFCKALWASATMPGFWALIDSIRLKDGTVYRNCADGGVRDNSPIMSAVEYIDRDETPTHRWGAVAANCNNDFLPEHYDGKMNLLEAVGRTYSIIMNEMGVSDFKTFELVNRIAQANGGTTTDGKKTYRYYNFSKIQPYENELGNSLSTDPKALRNRERLGKIHAEAYFAAQVA